MFTSSNASSFDRLSLGGGSQDRAHLLTPAERGSWLLSEWACLHQAPASLTPHNGPSSTPDSSWRTPPHGILPPEGFLLHLDPETKK